MMSLCTAARLIHSLELEIEKSLQSMGWNGIIGSPSRISPLRIRNLPDSTYYINASLDDLVLELIIEESPIPRLCHLSYDRN